MSLVDKFTIPLIDDKIRLFDISEKAGFVGMYSTDMNKPYLDNHVFLMYRLDTNPDYLNRFYNLMSCPSLYEHRFIKVNGITYELYAFSIINRAIKKLRNNSRLFSKEDVLRIISFWNFTDDEINNFTYSPTSFDTFQKFCETSVPEEDYPKELRLVYDQKSRASHFECSA